MALMQTPDIARRRFVGDQAAYFLPMAAFAVLTWAGAHWPGFYVASYVAKTLAVALLLILPRKHFTQIRWNHWRLGALMGVLGLIQWVAMEKGLLHVWPNYPRLSVPAFDPSAAFSSPLRMWTFIAVRWAGASLVVPVMEELFWRDFLWRSIAAPADFKLAPMGEWDRGIPLLVVTMLFCSAHVQWMTALVWGLMAGGLLLYTRSLGACIIMHGVTNFLLGAYVLWNHAWWFW